MGEKNVKNNYYVGSENKIRTKIEKRTGHNAVALK